MKIIENFLLEGAPKSPETVILQNKYYPKGLTEKQIYDYYMKVKKPLLNYIGNRSVSFFLMIDGQIIVKRKDKSGSRIQLTPANYEEFITGRILSIFINRMSKMTDYIVIDIDTGKGTPFSNLSNAFEVARRIMKKSELRSEEALFSGRGVHYIVHFNKKQDIDKLRNNVISNLKIQNVYPVTTTRPTSPGKVSFDMSPNFRNSMHVSKYSLSKEGLRVLDIHKGPINPKHYII
jgi:DNA primase